MGRGFALAQDLVGGVCGEAGSGRVGGWSSLSLGHRALQCEDGEVSRKGEVAALCVGGRAEGGMWRWLLRCLLLPWLLR